MAASFPLTPDLWKQWIADERKIIDEDEGGATKEEKNGDAGKSVTLAFVIRL